MPPRPAHYLLLLLLTILLSGCLGPGRAKQGPRVRGHGAGAGTKEMPSVAPPSWGRWGRAKVIAHYHGTQQRADSEIRWDMRRESELTPGPDGTGWTVSHTPRSEWTGTLVPPHLSGIFLREQVPTLHLDHAGLLESVEGVEQAYAFAKRLGQRDDPHAQLGPGFEAMRDEAAVVARLGDLWAQMLLGVVASRGALRSSVQQTYQPTLGVTVDTTHRTEHLGTVPCPNAPELQCIHVRVTTSLDAEQLREALKQVVLPPGPEGLRVALVDFELAGTTDFYGRPSTLAPRLVASTRTQRHTLKIDGQQEVQMGDVSHAEHILMFDDDTAWTEAVEGADAASVASVAPVPTDPLGELPCFHGCPTSASGAQTLVRRDLYTFAYDPETKLARWVAYVVEADPSGPAPDWKGDPALPSPHSLKPGDSPLGRGPWKRLDASVRRLAEKHGRVFVLSGPLYEKAGSPSTPSGYFKVVTLEDGRNASFIYPHDMPERVSECTSVFVPLRGIESRAGLQLFPVPGDTHPKLGARDGHLYDELCN